MGISFEINLLNGLTGDPAVCVNFSQSGESLLFDAGTLESLSNRELLKVRVVAISHAHVDHFIGFDRLIRVNVPHFRTVEVVGPKGITANIRGKLAGYTWNLLADDQVSFVVHEVARDGQVRSSHLSNTWNFEERPLSKAGSMDQPITEDKKWVCVPLQNFRYKLKATVVDHGTDVLAFCLSMPPSIGVQKEKLISSGLTPGPWISDLQTMAVNGDIRGYLDIDGSLHEAKDLALKLLQPKKGEQLVYVTDMVFSEANVRKLFDLVDHTPPDLLVCEANYRDEDRAKARDKSHLTSRQAAIIAAILGAKRLQIFHISNIYGGDSETSVRESAETLGKLGSLPSKELWELASKEFVSPA